MGSSLSVESPQPTPGASQASLPAVNSPRKPPGLNVDPKEAKRLAKEVEKQKRALALEEEKRRRALAEKAQREQARAVMMKRKEALSLAEADLGGANAPFGHRDA
ncbi:hypothetical protein JAAARDRAFT_35359 [Jaapia argillacea MUCL 33604]|uniref:Uncharacterized protein n=1 Tax=Jaapia argillacea MUCL 33604 TaxID=933084 RepID=A0A067PSF2_9AGAM|nr:hypothetical protein JAAARDRAFT_35359 [Jaapia argillacea MUCL 33604]